METARSLLLSTFLVSFGEKQLTIVYLINKIPSMITSGMSPFESPIGHVLNYSVLRVFVSIYYVL